MDRKRFGDQPCPIAQATDIFGDWWNLMILRETLYGSDTFSEFQEKLGISRNILNRRLKLLVEQGIFEKVLYQKPSRYRYKLTNKGKSALKVLAAIAAWSNEWVFDEETAPIRFLAKGTQQQVCPAVFDLNTGEAIPEMVLAPGPGFPESQQARDWRFGED